ncbi:MAG: M10 family metallopeptidase [Stappiaceae bacterium]
MALRDLSLEEIINQLDSGRTWQGNTISYTFPTSPWANMNESAGFSALTGNQASIARQALQSWDELIAPDLVETGGSGANADITVANTTTGIGYAHAYLPGGGPVSGSVWLNPQYNRGTSDLVNPDITDYGYLTYMHEVGHALGLEHMGEYNGGNPTYENDAFGIQDTQQYSIMSYFSPQQAGTADWVGGDGRLYFAQTPMVSDIAAIQRMYGADMKTRAGNTTYGFNSNVSSQVYNFAQNGHPVLSIWDGGGIDTLDVSGFSSSSVVDLREGQYSSVNNMTKNIGIAYDAEIENARTGNGADTVIGNALNNEVMSGVGNDSLNGLGGDDELRGEIGHDSMRGGSGDDLLIGGSGRDTLEGGSGNDRLYGGNDDDTLLGGAGNDLLKGGNGDDRLSGGTGDDELVGGNGSDVFVILQGNGDDIVSDFQIDLDDIDLSDTDFDSFDDLDISDNNGNAVLDLGDGNSVTLIDVNAADLSTDDFLFS